jgi:hypothetical protein
MLPPIAAMAELPPPDLDSALLEPKVRAALGLPDAAVLDWRIEPLAYPNLSQGSRALERVRGTARVGDGTLPWSLVVKTVKLPAEADVLGGEDPASYDSWRREPDAFESGVLADLPGGLRAPVSYGVDRPTPTSARIWLEEVHDADAAPWPVDRYAVAARHLGGFNGAYLAGRPLPDVPWLASARSVNEYWTEDPHVRRRLDRLSDPALGPTAALRAFLDDRSGYLDAIERLPQAFCHNDATRGNLFGGPGKGSGSTTVAIDWALAGVGPVGGELALLVSGSVMFGHVPPTELERLDRLAFEAYRDGLAEAGAEVDEATVRLGHAACSVLRMAAIVVAWLDLALDPAEADGAAGLWGRPAGELVDRWLPLVAFLERQAVVAGDLRNRPGARV